MPLETILFAAPATLAAALAAGLLGLFIGSFLNVVAHRLPIMRQRDFDNYVADEAGKDLPHQDRFNFFTPRSRCPHCGHRLSLAETMPVLGWLLLRGKCSACKGAVSVRYPIVEALTGLLSAALVWHFGSGFMGLASLVFIYLLIPIVLINYDTRIVPDELVLPLMWLGLLANLDGGIAPLRNAVTGAAAGYLVPWAINRLFKLVKHIDVIGQSYFKLLAAIGAWFGLFVPLSWDLPALYFFAPAATLAAALIAGVFGLLVGSFLNVVVHRLPIMDQRDFDNYIAHEAGQPLPHQDRFDLTMPRSRCPHCGHQITALENIPLISWLVLRGKCSACKAPISARYPIVELVTGLVSAGLAWHFGLDWMGLAVLGFGFLLIAMTLIDYDTKTLPDVLTYPLLWLGLLVNLDGAIVPLRDAVIGAVAGYMVLWTVSFLFEMVRGIPGMGNGDFKLLAGLGAWMGWVLLPTIVVLSSFVGAVVGLGLILFAGRARDNPIPFGPYLAAAGMIALLYGIPLTRYTQGLLLQA